MAENSKNEEKKDENFPKIEEETPSKLRKIKIKTLSNDIYDLTVPKDVIF